MNDKFIYVFSREDYEELLSSGMNLIKADESNHVYIFENDKKRKFDMNEMEFVITDVISF
ncbi:MAG: hypothetical protein IJ192_11730 [Clostridia bacterium]|nr:hypothetical protein [Clostridia bacterium]